jgi:OFA family oxalate/formate antiporter-like MFS transporter
MNEKQIRAHRKIYLFFGTLSMLFIGVIYAWPILKAPLASDFGWTPAQLAMNHTLTMVFIAAGNLLAGALSKKISFRFLLVCSALMIFFGFFFCSRINGKNIWELYFFYACLCGVGIGSFLVTTVSTVGDWFPDLKGICSSTMQCGFGFSALILGTIASRLIELPGFGWRKTYILIAFLIGTILLCVSIVLKKPAHGTVLPESKASSKYNSESLDITTKDMIKRPGFWRYYIFCSMVNGIGTALISFATDFFLFLGTSSAIAVIMVGLISVSNGLGRFFIGPVFDKTGRHPVIFVIAGITVASAAFLLISLPLNSVLFGALGACCAGITFGCIPSATGSIIRSSYGNSNYASNFSITLTSAMPSSFVAAIAGRILTNGGSYMTIFIIFFIMSMIAFGFSLNMKRL